MTDQPEWSMYPREIVARLARQAIAGFARTSDAPPDVEHYQWHWVPFGTGTARVELTAPILRWQQRRGRNPTDAGGAIHKRWSVITPMAEISGGAAECDRATTPFRITARFGWDEETGIAVLFFAEGGTLNPHEVTSCPTTAKT